MIILAGTTETLEVISSTTAPTDVLVSYVDITATTFVAGSQQVAITSAATTTILTAPVASTQRQAKVMYITNKDTVNSQTITLQKAVGAVKTVIAPATLLKAGEVLQYVDGMGVSVLDPFSRPKQASSSTLLNTPGVVNPYYVTASDLEKLVTLLLIEQKTTNLILQSGLCTDIPTDQLIPDLISQIL